MVKNIMIFKIKTKCQPDTDVAKLPIHSAVIKIKIFNEYRFLLRQQQQQKQFRVIKNCTFDH